MISRSIECQFLSDVTITMRFKFTPFLSQDRSSLLCNLKYIYVGLINEMDGTSLMNRNLDKKST